MDLDAVEHRLNLAARDPRLLFTSEPEAKFRELVKQVHPDVNPGKEDQAKVVLQKLERMRAAFTVAGTEVKNGDRTYQLILKLEEGNLSEVFLAKDQEGNERVLKMARSLTPGVRTFLKKEYDTLQDFHGRTSDPGFFHSQYFPVCYDYFIHDRRACTVMEHVSGYSFTQLKTIFHGRKIPDQHFVWIFKRILEGMGWIHKLGWSNCSLVPDHLMIKPEEHAVKVLGWVTSEKTGTGPAFVPGKYKAWYPKEKKTWNPSSDIYLAAQSLSYLFGGDPQNKKLPIGMHPNLRLFLQSCLLESPGSRVSDAWQVLENLTELARKLFGPPKFVQLELT